MMNDIFKLLASKKIINMQEKKLNPEYKKLSKKEKEQDKLIENILLLLLTHSK